MPFTSKKEVQGRQEFRFLLEDVTQYQFSLLILPADFSWFYGLEL